MTTTVYQYPKCSTCRNALKWLDQHGVAYRAVDLVAQPPSAATLRELLRRSGLPIARFFNTSGDSYRAGNFKERLPKLSEAQALEALAADGKLIKRPIVDIGAGGAVMDAGGADTGADKGGVLVGFDAEAYQQKLSSHGARRR